jgi:hypothetical protein
MPKFDLVIGIRRIIGGMLLLAKVATDHEEWTNVDMDRERDPIVVSSYYIQTDSVTSVLHNHG